MSYRTRVAAVLLVAACGSLLVTAAWAAVPVLRVIGGRDANYGGFPYVVKAQMHITTTYKNKQIPTSYEVSNMGCSAAVLTATWSLSAAHCGEKANWTKTTDNHVKEARLFITHYNSPLAKPSENDTSSKVWKTIFLPKVRYGRIQKYKSKHEFAINDVALLNTEPFLIDKYAKISAIDYTALYGHEVTIAGYGVEKRGLFQGLHVMKAMLKSCDNSNYKYTISPSMCAVPECGVIQTASPGDSGSALLHPSGVVGVASAGRYLSMIESLQPPPAYRPKRPTTNVTPISPYIDWIINIINEKPLKPVT